MVTITVSGPGMIINNEIAIIEKALKDIGYTVNMENRLYDSGENYIDFVKNRIENGSKFEVTIVAKHQPWGG